MIRLSQLTRRPVKTLLGIVLVMIACTLLCVSLGQYIASFLTRRQVETEYTTIALPTDKFKREEVLDEDGNVISVSYWEDQPWQIQEILSGLPDRFPEAVQSAEWQGLISGYCSSMEPLNYTQSPYSHRSSVEDYVAGVNVDPYTQAMLVITVEEISDIYSTWGMMDPENYGIIADITGTVLEVCALQEGYDDPVGRTVHLKVWAESAEAFAALDVAAGKNYLVYGTGYMDYDWILRCEIGADKQEVYDNISWSNIVPLTEEQKKQLNANNDLYGITEEMVALYQDGEYGLYLSESDLERINSCSLTVCANPSLLRGCLLEEEIIFLSEDGIETIPTEEYIRLYQRAGIVRLDASADDFLEAPDSGIWQTAYQAIEINNHSFPVIATGNLRSIAQFGIQDALLTDGRMFTAEEYEQGAPVCVLSESLAVQNGLEVGDCINLQYYEADGRLPWQSIMQAANPCSFFYSPVEGFSSEEIVCEIVGLYRQKQEWSQTAYSFTPNTIFVPEKSVSGRTKTTSSGMFCSFVLKNGMAGKLEEELSALGYEGLLAYYDQGYSDIADSLSEYFVVARRILLAGIISWCIVIAAFLFLFPGHQRREAQRMWTLGAPRSWVISHIVAGGMGIVLPGVILGSIISGSLMRSLLMQIGNGGIISLEWPQALLLAGILGLAQLAGITGLVYVTVRVSVRAFYRK